MSPRIVANLWFDGQAESAAEFYVSVFPNSRITATARYTDAGPGPVGSVMTVEFELDGQRFVGINGGPQFPFTEAISFQIDRADQDEIDYYWQRLTDGGSQDRCGWLKDRFGVSWQVAPSGMADFFDDPKRAERAMRAMFEMRKLDLAALKAAADRATSDRSPPRTGVDGASPACHHSNMRSVVLFLLWRLAHGPGGRLAERPPLRCPRGHRLTRGDMLVGWLPCDCRPRRQGPAGHRTYLCQARVGADVCGAELYRPPCRRARAP